MADWPVEKSTSRLAPSSVQVRFPIAPPVLGAAEGEWEIVALEPTIEVRQRIEVIQQLISAEGTERYGKVQVQGAEKLGISVRGVQRLMKRWREQGLSALSQLSCISIDVVDLALIVV